MMVTFRLEDDGAADDNKDHITRADMTSVPMVDDTIELKGQEYVVRSRRWKIGRLGPSATVSVRAVLETTVQ